MEFTEARRQFSIPHPCICGGRLLSLPLLSLPSSLHMGGSSLKSGSALKSVGKADLFFINYLQ